MNMSDMGGDTGVPGVDATTLVLRIVLLSATAVVTGIGLLRPLVPSATRHTVLVAWAASAVAAVGDLISVLALKVNLPFALAHLVLVLGLPLLLRWSTPPAAAGFGLAAVLIGEISLGHKGLGFLADTAYTLGVAIWLGLTVLSRRHAPAGWTNTSLRPAAVAVAIAVTLALAGVLRLTLSGIGFDRRLYESAFGLALLAVVALPVALTALTVLAARGPEAPTQWRVYPIGAVLVAVAFLAWSNAAAIPRPTDLPIAGVPLLRELSLAGKQLPMLVSPQRPGKNLVHFPDSAGSDVVITAEGGPPIRATARPGSTGSWADVDLPSGRSDLLVTRSGARDSIEVDAGTAPGPPSAAGTDGPECASAALGSLIDDRQGVLTRCPADGLTAQDADALRIVVGFLATNAVPAVTIVGDTSPRAAQATEVVRAAATQRHVPVSETPRPDGAVVVVSGWSTAAGELASVADLQSRVPTYTHGVYLAPWLLTAPAVKSVVSSALPLRFDPREERSLRYTISLANRFGGERASAAGFTEWLAAQQQTLDEPVRIYASAQVNAMPMDSSTGSMSDMAMDNNYPGQWIPDSTVVAVSGPLSP